MGGVQCQISGFDLLYAGYGLQDADLYFKIVAWDDHQNIYSQHQTVKIQAVPGITKVGGQQGCGSPTITCKSGCTLPVYPLPAAHVAPAPAPPWQGTDNGVTLPPNQVAQISGSKGWFDLPSIPWPDAATRSGNGTGIPTEWTSWCFPPGALVRLATGEETPASSLRPGDELRGAGHTSTQFLQDFHEFDVGRATRQTTYLKIEHAHQRVGHPLLISANHLVNRAGVGFVPAAELRVGHDLLAYKDG